MNRGLEASGACPTLSLDAATVVLDVARGEANGCLLAAAAAVWISGVIQTAIYCDFFYYYIKSWQNNEKLALPA
jgi:hypothetical protein